MGVDDHFESSRMLFDRYLKNECTPDEVRELIRYFGASDREESLRDLVSSALTAESANQPEADEAVREVYSKLMEKIVPERSEPEIPVRKLPVFSRMAAVWIALIISAGALYFFSKNSSKIGSDGSAITAMTSETKTGERKKVVLDDGTVVWLNAVSKLSFPEKFTAGTREVTLEGEAYFEVFRDTKRPFMVHSGEVVTKVLGTSFDIKAYETDQTLSVSVMTGKVEVNSMRGSDPVLLTPDQQAVYSKAAGKITTNGINAKALLAWKEGRMQFRNVMLDDVVSTLKRSYHVTISYDPKLKNCPVYADFEANTPVFSVLEMLSISLGGKVTKSSESSFHLLGDGCR